MIDPRPRNVIEDHVKVYLTADDEGRWRIDSTTVDGYPLDGLTNGPDDSQCECERGPEHDAAVQRVIDAAHYIDA